MNYKNVHFADDINLFVAGKNLHEQIEMNSSLINVSQWLHVNKLSLKIRKTHYTCSQRKLNQGIMYQLR